MPSDPLSQSAPARAMARLGPSRATVELDDDELATAWILHALPDSKALRKRRAREAIARLELVAPRNLS